MRLLVLFFILTTSGSALADKEPEPWYRGKYGRNRVFHLTLTGTLGVTYLASEAVFKDSLVQESCRWCEPPSFDDATRNALVWNNTERAHLISNVNAFVVAPVVGLTLLVLSEKNTNVSRLIDDLLPVLETVAISQVLTQIVKFTVARQRPYAHYATGPFEKGNDDNLSFWSGHSALGFSITASAGVVAHWRGYWTEPYIWGAGIALSLSTEYLRIAADKHYLSDVLVGGFVGLGSGLLIPRLMSRELAVVPTKDGAAVVGQF